MNARTGKSRNAGKDEKDAFSGNLKEMMREAQEARETGGEVKKCSSAQMDYQYGRAAAGIKIYQNGRVGMGALLECESRHISYSESDAVKAFVLEGYTLKAKVIADEHVVYIEKTSEDGSSQAYQVNPLEIAENTENPIEQIAAEAWEKTREMLNGGTFTEWDLDAGTQEEKAAEFLTFEEMLVAFKDFVEKRIKEGPPKIPTGGAEFSEEEWKNLLKKIDKDIDAYKEELRERIRKNNGQRILAKKAGSAVEKRAPYSYLKDETGNITYNGVTFVCDDKKQQICLGDMSDPKNVLTIPLSEGGCLKVNRDNIADLAKAIDMFSPEDVGRILRAIAQDAKARGEEMEMKKASLLEAF